MKLAWRATQEAAGGAGVYSQDDRELWAAVAECERRDVLPEFWSGHNIADFVDAEVDERLAALEAEEDAAAATWQAQVRVGCCTLSQEGEGEEVRTHGTVVPSSAGTSAGSGTPRLPSERRRTCWLSAGSVTLPQHSVSACTYPVTAGVSWVVPVRAAPTGGWTPCAGAGGNGRR